MCRCHSQLVLLYFIIHCSRRASLFNDLQRSCYSFFRFYLFHFLFSFILLVFDYNLFFRLWRRILKKLPSPPSSYTLKSMNPPPSPPFKGRLICMANILKFTERPKTPGITSKKTWLSLKRMKGNKLFSGDFRANLDEKNADMVQFTKRWNWKWIV